MTDYNFRNLLLHKRIGHSYKVVYVDKDGEYLILEHYSRNKIKECYIKYENIFGSKIKIL